MISMNIIVLAIVCVSTVLALPAQPCSANCKRENNCVCASRLSPLPTERTPQLVTLTFDDSVTSSVYDTYYEQLIFKRKNPNNKPITATFYIPHEYTDYEKVNKLYNKGFDIGVHSISKHFSVDYWKNASVQDLIDEFGGQRKIISKFANIPISDIRGVRTPHLQLAGDKTFEAYSKSGLIYDSSWTALSDNPLFPFTLEYLINQPCIIGSCPTQSFPNMWINPIINFIAPNGNQCNILFSCTAQGSANDIKDWLVTQFNRTYHKNRAPLTLIVNSAWFQVTANSLEGFTKFLDYLGTLKDVFLVSDSEVINWAKQSIALENYRPDHITKNQTCNAVTCPLKFIGSQTRYMRSCVPCPQVYPWLKNPEGNA